MLRQRRPLLVEDASSDPRALGLLAGARSFVAAPIVCQGRALGLIHADCALSEEPVTEFDRDTLWAFAEGFGYAVERSVLADRLRAQSERVVALVRSAEASVGDLSTAEIQLGADARRQPARSTRPTRDDCFDAELTRREREVLGMLAEGETNARIAQRLVVSQDTVKTHVKHILRKLGVHNRSQAVSALLQGTGGVRKCPLGGRKITTSLDAGVAATQQSGWMATTPLNGHVPPDVPGAGAGPTGAATDGCGADQERARERAARRRAAGGGASNRPAGDRLRGRQRRRYSGVGPGPGLRRLDARSSC